MRFPKTIVIATGNPGKAKEFKAVFGAAGYDVRTLKDYPSLPDVEETGTTFEENAALKRKPSPEFWEDRC